VTDSPDPPVLLELTAYLLSQTARVAKGRLDERLADRGLRLRDMAVLAAVADEDLTSQLAVGRAVRLDASDVTGTVDRLQRSGFVERVVDPADRRRRVVRLTARGRTELAELRAIAGRVADELLAPLPLERRRQLHDDLSVVLRAARSADR
jgi:DNA-binding MarR family transcriptional regulator